MKSLNAPEILSLLPQEGNSDSELLVTLAVRGAKNLPDVIADVLLEPVECVEAMHMVEFWRIE